MMKVLLVDDETPVLNHLKSGIPWKQLGLQVCGCLSNGAEAFAYMKEHPVDILITDIRMPGMDELGLCRRVRDNNQADQLIYSTEKTLKELGDKLTDADKAKVNDELERFKKTREGNNAEEIKKAMESFTQETYAIFGKVYQQQQGNGGDQNQQGGPQAGGTSDDGTVESSFTE